MVRYGISEKMANMFDETVVTLLVALIAVGLDMLCRRLIVGGMRRYTSRSKRQWSKMLLDSGAVANMIHIVPGVAVYLLLPYMFVHGKRIFDISGKLCAVYIVLMVLLSLNSIITITLDIYNRKATYKNMPLKGVIEMSRIAVFFIGGLIALALLLGKSPTTLIAGLGASAAILMLVFKDTILGFVASLQLSAYDMLRPGDRIQLSNGDIFGTVEEVTLVTVKIRNRDNTISTVPPYSLITGTFRNWRAMMESGGRRVDKNILIDLSTIKFCTTEMLDLYRRTIPLLAGYNPDVGIIPTNVQLLRLYIELYLRSKTSVNSELDIIVSQQQMTPYGLPIQVYFFLYDKALREYELAQSDIFDHLLAMVPRFDLKLYQFDTCHGISNEQ